MKTPPTIWKLQVIPPLDQFNGFTLSVEQWLDNDAETGYQMNKTAKWAVLMEAAVLVKDGVDRQGGLRQEPRVGYDAVGDQPVLIFKASNNGTTFLVSPDGVNGLKEI